MRFIYKETEFRLHFRHDNGVTTAYLRTPVASNDLASAQARCSTKDKFVKETGRKIALTRMLAPLSKEFRTAVWTCYLNRKNTEVKKLASKAA